MRRALRELGRRRFYRMAAGHAVGALITLTAAQVMASVFPMPVWWYPCLVATVIAGFPIRVALKAT